MKNPATPSNSKIPIRIVWQFLSYWTTAKTQHEKAFSGLRLCVWRSFFKFNAKRWWRWRWSGRGCVGARWLGQLARGSKKTWTSQQKKSPKKWVMCVQCISDEQHEIFMFRSEVEAARACTSVLHIRVRARNGSITCDHDSENRATPSVRILPSPLGAWREWRKKERKNEKLLDWFIVKENCWPIIMCCWCLQPKITNEFPMMSFDVENGNLFPNWHESLSSALRRDSPTFTPFSCSRQLFAMRLTFTRKISYLNLNKRFLRLLRTAVC